MGPEEDVVEEPVVEEAPETPEVPAEEPAEEPAAPESGSGPWAADLEAAFDDPTLRASVDEFLRGKVQPYVTQLEQRTAPDENAKRLWDSFHADPMATYQQITSEVLPDDLAEQVLAVLEGEPDDWGDDDEPEGSSDLTEYPPEIQELIEARQREQYEAVLEGVKDKLAEDDLPFHRQQFEPYLVANHGDLDAAIDAYRDWLKQAKELFGIKIPKPEDIPPPTINSSTPSPAMAPPVEQSYGSLDDAVDAFFAEQKAPPPNVGAV